jgi:polysaccharide biosynthesis protein PslH
LSSVEVSYSSICQNNQGCKEDIFFKSSFVIIHFTYQYVMNLLFLTEIAPFPPNGGEKLRSYGLLKLMSGLNLTVHAITGNKPCSESESRLLPGIQFYPFEFQKNRPNRKIIRYYRLFSRNKELISLINKILQNNAIDVAYIDYHLYGQYINFFRRREIPVIYGTHNAQAVLINQRPAVSFKNRITKFIEFSVNRFHERIYFSKADACIVVSENDKKYHQAFIKADKIFVIPNFLLESEYPPSSGAKENYVLMTANFLAFQNALGLEWFLKEVWDADLWEKTRLVLLGVGSKEVFGTLEGKYDGKHVEALGEVSDLKPYISRAMVSIVPLLHGSGSRLKCLESMALKTQLVSTSKGAEGIDHHNSIVIADSPNDFKQALLAIMENKTDFTEKAYHAFMARYSLKPNMMIFTSILDSIAHDRSKAFDHAG